MPVRCLFTLIALTVAGLAQAAMVAKPVEYRVADKTMQSVLVYDDAVRTPRPGLVMAPNWMGMNEAQVEKAKAIAGQDYVILVADVYGSDVRPKNPDEAGAAAKAMYADRKLLRARIGAALDALRAQVGKAPLDGRHYGAIGFCFGGATALDLARSGADIAGVVSFHGNLATDDPALAKNIKAHVLVQNGGDDRFVPAEQIQAFEAEMRDAGVDWQFINYGGAVHCFAEPDAKGEVPGCRYDERSATRAFARMREFFAEVFRADRA